MACILIVESPGTFRDGVLAAIARGGHAARPADDVLTAAAELLVEPTDVVVLGRGAAAAAADMAADPRCAWLGTVPFVLISDGDGREDDAATADASGLDVRGRVPRAPFAPDRLLAAIETALRPAWDDPRTDARHARKPPPGPNPKPPR